MNRIESVVAHVVGPTSSKAAEAIASVEQVDRTAPTFFQVLADAEDAASTTTAHCEALGALFVRLGNEVSKVAPGMNRATTANRRLAISRQLAQAITPLSTALTEKANGLRLAINKWDRAVKMITARS